ncbi:MAG TPA: TrbC/VirB2 family protein [Candidatus Paceibacterota bacterium]|nr:TrbC/VirB2 family protein [Candidatus Paceibacterota bacterium]
MLKKRKLLLTGLSLLGMGFPLLAQAQGGFLSGISADCYNMGNCNFCDIGKVITNVFNFLRNDIALPLAVLMIVYGGVMMIFSAGSSSRVASGRKILMSAIIGFAIVLGASLIINTALTIFSKSQLTISNVFSANGISCINVGQ